MPTSVEKLSIALTPEMAAMVRAAVERGDYVSTSEVIREALRLWKEQETLRALEVEERRRLWREGIESGPAEPADMDEIKAMGRALLDQERERERAA